MPANDSMTDAQWRALKESAVSDIVMAAGWSVPELLPEPIDSAGWQDSVAISPDGKTLRFSYVGMDLISWTEDGSDFETITDYQRGPVRDNPLFFSVKTYVSYRQVDGSWSEPVLEAISQAATASDTESGFEERDGNLYHNREIAAESPLVVQIYRDGDKLSVNDPNVDEYDPSYFNGELYWFREGSPSVIYSATELSPDAWDVPAALPSAINDGNNSRQPHITETGYLLFVSDRDGWSDIWSSRQISGGWAPAQKVASFNRVSPEGIAGLFEPSATSDGQTIYFDVLFTNQYGARALSPVVSRRLFDPGVIAWADAETGDTTELAFASGGITVTTDAAIRGKYGFSVVTQVSDSEIGILARPDGGFLSSEDTYASCLFRMSTLPGAEEALFYINDASSNAKAYVTIDAGGLLRFRNNGLAQVGDPSVAIAEGERHSMTWHVGTGSDGACTGSLWLDSVLVATTTAGTFGSGLAGYFVFGKIANFNSTAYTAHVDQIRVREDSAAHLTPDPVSFTQRVTKRGFFHGV